MLLESCWFLKVFILHSQMYAHKNTWSSPWESPSCCLAAAWCIPQSSMSSLTLPGKQLNQGPALNLPNMQCHVAVDPNVTVYVPEYLYTEWSLQPFSSLFHPGIFCFPITSLWHHGWQCWCWHCSCDAEGQRLLRSLVSLRLKLRRFAFSAAQLLWPLWQSASIMFTSVIHHQLSSNLKSSTFIVLTGSSSFCAERESLNPQ